MNRTLTAALTLIALATPAAAMEAFMCPQGTAVLHDAAKNEMIVAGAIDGFDLVLPFAASAGRFSTWSRVTGPDGAICADTTAPCVEYWQPKVGKPIVTYQIEPGGRRVACE